MLTMGICMLLMLLAGCVGVLSNGIDAPVGSVKSKVDVHESVLALTEGSNVTHHCVIDAVIGAPLETVLPWLVAAATIEGSCAVTVSSSLGVVIWKGNVWESGTGGSEEASSVVLTKPVCLGHCTGIRFPGMVSNRSSKVT